MTRPSIHVNSEEFLVMLFPGFSSALSTSLAGGYMALRGAVEHIGGKLTVPPPLGVGIYRQEIFTHSGWLAAAERILKNRRTQMSEGYSPWAAVGMSAGGVIAAHLAARVPDCRAVAIYETPLRWTSWMQELLREKADAGQTPVALGDCFFESLLNLEDAEFDCPCLFLCGDSESSTFDSYQRDLISKERPQWRVELLPGAGHRLFGEAKSLTQDSAVMIVTEFIHEQIH